MKYKGEISVNAEVGGVVSNFVLCGASVEFQSAQIPILDSAMREIVHLQVGQCGNQIGSKVHLKIF